jgi:hypothetical protein
MALNISSRYNEYDNLEFMVKNSSVYNKGLIKTDTNTKYLNITLNTYIMGELNLNITLLENIFCKYIDIIDKELDTLGPVWTTGILDCSFYKFNFTIVNYSQLEKIKDLFSKIRIIKHDQIEYTLHTDIDTYFEGEGDYEYF